MKKLVVMGKYSFPVVILFVISAALAACQSGPPQIAIEDARAELSPAIIGESMITMNIKNQGGPDILTGVKTDIPGAKASFHIMQGGRMASVETVKVPAKSGLKFEMGGSHIMIEDMPKTMGEGSRFNLTLVFQKSGEMKMTLTLQKAAAMPMDMGQHM